MQTAEALVINCVVLGELLAGFKNGTRYEDNMSWLEKFLSSPRVKLLGVDQDTADRYSEIFVDLQRRGSPIPTNDVWIAASAMQHGVYVLTTDPHFNRVQQVVVEYHPAEATPG